MSEDTQIVLARLDERFGAVGLRFDILNKGQDEMKAAIEHLTTRAGNLETDQAIGRVKLAFLIAGVTFLTSGAMSLAVSLVVWHFMKG